MAGIITTLQLQKKNKNRVNVYLDEQFAFSLTLIQAARLKRGEYLSDEAIERLRQEDERQEAHERALAFLHYRPRSETEVRRYLLGKGFVEPVVQDVLTRLRRSELLDDGEFARFWVENRQRFRPRGRRALRYELTTKGLSEEDIADALEGVDEEETAYALARAQAEKWAALAPRELQRRLGQYLARRGFAYSVVADVLLRLKEDLSLDSDDFID